jgi:hypothetical protein
MHRWLTLLLVSLLLAAPVSAHPFGTKFHSMRHELRMGEQGLEVVVILEVPTQVVLRAYQSRYAEAEISTEDAERDFLAWWCERLGQGLQLTVDGQPAAGRWVQADHPSNGRGGEQFFVYLLSYELQQQPAPGGRVEVGLVNASLPKAKMYYSSFAEASGGWRVVANSARDLIGAKADAAEVSDDPDAWTRDEGARSLAVVFER